MLIGPHGPALPGPIICMPDSDFLLMSRTMFPFLRTILYLHRASRGAKTNHDQSEKMPGKVGERDLCELTVAVQCTISLLHTLILSSKLSC